MVDEQVLEAVSRKCPKCDLKLRVKSVSGVPAFVKKFSTNGARQFIWVENDWTDRGCIAYDCETCGVEIEAWLPASGVWEVIGSV